MTRATWLLIVGCALVLLGETPRSLCAEPHEEEIIKESRRNSLKGLVGVHLRVNRLDPAARHLDLSADLLRGDMASRLRSASIPVFMRKEGEAQPGPSYLDLTLSVVESSGSVRVFGVRLALIQNIYLERKSDRVFRASTWSVSVTGYADEPQAEAIRAQVRKLADRFCEDFHAVNRTGRRPGAPLFEIKYDGPLESCRRWEKGEDFIHKLAWDYAGLLEHFPKEEVAKAAKETCKRAVSSQNEFEVCIACTLQIIDQQVQAENP